MPTLSVWDRTPGIPVYDGVDLLDVAVPYEMFKWVDKNKGLKTVIRSKDGCPITTHNALRFQAHSSFAEVETLNVSWVPGGSPAALSRIMSDPDSPYLTYIKQVASGAKGSVRSAKVPC